MTEPRNRKTVTRTYTNIDQTDTTMDFDGMINKSLPKGSNKYAGNQFRGTQTENAGRGPTQGNQDYRPKSSGPSATADAFKPVPTSPVPQAKKLKSPDYINGGAQYRGQGGVVAKCPPNPDRINAGNTGGRKSETFLK